MKYMSQMAQKGERMANDYTLSAKITGDASGFEKAIGKAQSQLSKIASKFESFGAGCTKVGKAFTAFRHRYSFT